MLLKQHNEPIETWTMERLLKVQYWTKSKLNKILFHKKTIDFSPPPRIASKWQFFVSNFRKRNWSISWKVESKKSLFDSKAGRSCRRMLRRFNVVSTNIRFQWIGPRAFSIKLFNDVINSNLVGLKLSVTCTLLSKFYTSSKLVSFH